MTNKNNEVLFITGANKGLGAAIAKDLSIMVIKWLRQLLVGQGMVGAVEILHVFPNTMLDVKFLTTPILNK